MLAMYTATVEARKIATEQVVRVRVRVPMGVGDAKG